MPMAVQLQMMYLVDILNVDIVQNDTSICLGESISLDATSNVPGFNVTPTMHLVPSEYTTIQLAIDAAVNGDTIYVSNGTYFENINYNNKDLYLLGENREGTIIDGNQNGSVVTMDGNSVIDGFTIQNGESVQGGGIKIDITNAGNPTITMINLIIENCRGIGDIDGGGIYIRNTFGNCLLKDVIFNNNYGRKGGALAHNSGNLNVENCQFTNNEGTENGSAIAIYSNANINVKNSLFKGNFGFQTIWLQAGNLQIENSTIVNNTTAELIYIFESDSLNFPDFDLRIDNSILYSNLLNQISTNWNHIDSVEVNYSNIKNGWLGNSNITSTPQFADSANGDYTLVPGSPGLDAGNPDLNGNGIPWQNDPEDQDPDGTRMDIGYGYAAQGPVINFSSPIISSSAGDVFLRLVYW